MASDQGKSPIQSATRRAPQFDPGFRALAEQAPVMIWRSGSDRRCDYFNQRWLDFTGRTLWEELALGWTRSIHPDDYQRCLEMLKAAYGTRLPFTMDYHLRRHDGVYRWVLSNGVPFYENDAFAGFLGACVDISEHEEKPTDDGSDRNGQLRELNHRLKSSLQTSICFSAYGRPLAEQATQDDLSKITERLSLLALAHEKLVTFDNEGSSFCAYLVSLAEAVHAAIGKTNIDLRVSCEPVNLSSKRASTIGSVVDELLIAALTQRFPRERPGTIQVRSRSLAGDGIEVSVADDGERSQAGAASAPHSFDRQLIERRIAHANGTIRYEIDEGTRCVVTLGPELKRAGCEAVRLG